MTIPLLASMATMYEVMCTAENTGGDRGPRRYDTYWVWNQAGTAVTDMHITIHDDYVLNRHGY